MQKIKKKSNGKVIPIPSQEYINQKSNWEFRCTEYPVHPIWKTNVGNVLNRENYVGCRYCLGERPLRSTKELKNRLFEIFESKIILVKVIGKELNIRNSKIQIMSRP